MQHNSTIYTTMRPASGGKSLVTFSTYEERQEALKRTTMMEDDVNHRASRNITAESMNKNGKLTNGNQSAQITKQEQRNIQLQQQQQQQQQLHIPPPPPQFANSPPKKSQTQQMNATYKVTQISSSSNATKQYTASKPPSSPTPDYDNVQMRASSASRITSASANYANSNIFITNGRESNNTGTANRRTTMRLGTVTIGEYEHEHQRREPGKFDFISAQKRSQQYHQIQQQQHNEEQQTLRSELQNTLSRSNLKKSNSSQQRIEHQSNCPLQNGYDNNNGGGVEGITHKLQNAARVSSKTDSPTNAVDSAGAVAGTASARSSISNGSVTGGGILKNGNRNSNNGGTFTKNTEKTITFDN